MTSLARTCWSRMRPRRSPPRSNWPTYFFQNMGQSRPLFVYFRPFRITIQFWLEKGKARRFCAWDSNHPGPQSGRRRQIHWAMAVAHWPTCLSTLTRQVLLILYVRNVRQQQREAETWTRDDKNKNQSASSLFRSCFLSNVRLTSSVTILGHLLDFGQVFKAFGNNFFAPISHILRQFLWRCQNLSFFL